MRGARPAQVIVSSEWVGEQDVVRLFVVGGSSAGIGDSGGLLVRQRLGEFAAHHQVVIVTHLPQVAAFADRHFLVKKAVDKKGKDGRTRSLVGVLSGAQIEGELAAMAGDGGDAATLEQARSLVRKGKAKRRPSTPAADGKDHAADQPG